MEAQRCIMTKNDWRMCVARKGLFVNGKTIIW